jgi:alkanesulfonate monooxygenase SsuD/methylene tetrahydromethanopterin reductase-like flavin-dependent oxidoreductase (luciferase family)
MLGLNVCAAETDEAARLLFSSIQQAFINLRTGRPGKMPPPLAGYEDGLAMPERAILRQTLSCSVIGGPETVKAGLADFIQRTGADEIMVTSPIFDHAARLRSVEITAEIRDALGG